MLGFVLEFLVILALVLINGVFAMAEMALVSARRPRLESMAAAGNGGARRALALSEVPGRFLSTVQVGITLVGIIAGAYGGATFAHEIEPLLRPWLGENAYGVAFAVVVALITYLSLVVGELVPKRFALRHAEAIASFMAGPMTALSIAASPIVWLLEVSSASLLRLLGVHREDREDVTEDEVLASIRAGTSAGVVDPRAGDLIESVLGVGDQSVRAIMVPRRDMVVLRADEPPADALARIARSGRSRYPLLRGSGDEIVGIVRATDIAAALAGGRPVDLEAMARPPLIVPDQTTVLRLLELFKDASVHLAVIVDEYGSIEGLATPSDILEAIAGSFEEGGEHSPDPDIVPRGDGSWLIDGLAPLTDVERRIGVAGLVDEDADYSRLAGFVLHRLGRIPRAGDAFTWEGCSFEVVDMDGRRVDKVLVTKAGSLE